jgi:hypothetical protein
MSTQFTGLARSGALELWRSIEMCAGTPMPSDPFYEAHRHCARSVRVS